MAALTDRAGDAADRSLRDAAVAVVVIVAMLVALVVACTIVGVHLPLP